MGDGGNDNEVFISYSHKDEVWMKRLLLHLQALQHVGTVTPWTDRKIDGGDTWYPEIEQAMDRAKAAVLLISPAFQASGFCVNKEVPYLMKRREDEGLVVIPVLIKPCPKGAIERLRQIQMFPRDGKSVAINFKANYDVVFAEVANSLERAVRRAETGAPPVVPELPPPDWAPLPEESVDTTSLPVTGAELFGRQKELTALEKAWNEERLNVAAFVAWGGVGKSSLVNRWLERMAADNYRGARRVFAWSFYSQGTNDRTSSADRFINEGLAWFGDEDPTAGSAWAKGERLAKLIAGQRTLLILDGMEPLQSPRDVDRGHVKDPALMMLLRGLARHNPGLCVITTRVGVRGLERYGDAFDQHDLEHISPEAGRSLLRVRGVRGTDAELEHATRDFGCHSLAVRLLASYIHDVPHHPIAAAAEIPDLDVPVEKGRHPRRVIAAFQRRFGEGAEVELLRILGLFDRPATGPELKAILATPPIERLTTTLSSLGEAGRLGVVDKLREIGLIATKSTHAPDELDAHPLVREHFGEQLEKEYPEGWRAGHDRLYEYLKGPGCEKDLPDTAQEMAPLYAAVHHGCAAGRHQQVVAEVYSRRIQRGQEFYNLSKRGAYGADLGALAGLFDEPWSRPVASFAEDDQSFFLNQAGADLRALGRLNEALEPMLAGLDRYVVAKSWNAAARVAGNVSQLSLTLGRAGDAVDYADRSVDYADRNVDYADPSDDAFMRVVARTTLADALHQAGRASQARGLFDEAERMQKDDTPEYPALYSLHGHQYCDLLLSQDEHQAVIGRATKTLEWATRNLGLLAIALDHLSLGRAHALAARSNGLEPPAEARTHLDAAVDGLRDAGAQEFIPRGLLARAELFAYTGDHDAARADLEEAEDIATRDPQGTMKLHLTDCHLGFARLALAEAAAVSAASAAASTDVGATADTHLDTARQRLAKARDLIEETGYHRRDAELAELDQQLAGAGR